MPLGVVVGAHGLKGELRVRASGDDLESLLQVPSVQLLRAEAAGHAADPGRQGEYPVESVRPGRAGECRLALRGVDDREAAEALRGARVLARAEHLPALAAGEFYAYELVGCMVCSADGAEIGTVKSILETGGPDLLVIAGADGRERMVPAAEPLLREVDLAARRIRVELPPGLLDGDGARDAQPDPGTGGGTSCSGST